MGDSPGSSTSSGSSSSGSPQKDEESKRGNGEKETLASADTPTPPQGEAPDAPTPTRPQDDEGTGHTTYHQTNTVSAIVVLTEEDVARHRTQRTITSNYTGPGGKVAVPHSIRPCGVSEEFEMLNKISEGSYGVVWRALHKETNVVYALKEVKMNREKEGFPQTALRELNILLSLRHANIVNVERIVVGERSETNKDPIFLVMEYVPHDLKNLVEVRNVAFSYAQVKCLMWQLCNACEYMHSNWVLHRDLKSSNLLYTDNGILKVCDFGLARPYSDPVTKMTPEVQTLWYRAPEILFGEDQYTPAVDIWSLGCIFVELLQRKPLFPYKTEWEAVKGICSLLGSPTPESFPTFMQLPFAKLGKFDLPENTENCLGELFTHALGKGVISPATIDLITKMLSVNPEHRITASEALNHPYFKEEPEMVQPSDMPTFASTNEEPHRKKFKGERPSRVTGSKPDTNDKAGKT